MPSIYGGYTEHIRAYTCIYGTCGAYTEHIRDFFGHIRDIYVRWLAYTEHIRGCFLAYTEHIRGICVAYTGHIRSIYVHIRAYTGNSSYEHWMPYVLHYLSKKTHQEEPQSTKDIPSISFATSSMASSSRAK